MKLHFSRRHFIIITTVAILFSGVVIFLASTQFSGNDKTRLTFTAKRGELIISVEALGVLEAKHAHTVVTPRLNWAMSKVAWLPPEGSWVKKGDVIVELEAGEVERKYLNALNEVDIAKADAEKGGAEMAMQHVLLESQLQNTEASLSASQLQLSRMAFESPKTQEIRKLRIAQDEVELEKIRRKLDASEKISKEERTRLHLKVRQAESKLKQARHMLSQLQLKAPADGFIEYARHWSGDKITVGTQLWPNMPIVKIPELSVMQVKLQVGETDAQKLKKSQRAVITIPSMRDLRLSGKVRKVDRIAKPIRKNRKPTKIKRVEVVVEIDSTDAELAPGLTAECRIIVDKIEDVVTLPHECVFDRDSVKVVYVLADDFYIPYPVSVEKPGDDFLALISDLKGGERCALREPGPSRVKWPKILKAPRKLTKPDTLLSQPIDSLTKKERFSVNLIKESTLKSKKKPD
ncbi:MAG: efflux RND transporter periplasmic adaptor subunit [bacterium]